MTREEFNQLDSDCKFPCPDCGEKITHPYPGCHCPPNLSGYGTRHTNLYHHTCSKVKKVEEVK